MPSFCSGVVLSLWLKLETKKGNKDPFFPVYSLLRKKKLGMLERDFLATIDVHDFFS